MRILIVEPNSQLQNRVQRLLNFSDEVESITILSNPNNLLDAARQLKPDVVIFDVLLFGFEGMDCISSIKKKFPKIIIIILSDFLFPKYVERCLEAGADYFLDKLLAYEKIPQLLEQKVKVNK